jgi:serine/threonine protein kinase
MWLVASGQMNAPASRNIVAGKYALDRKLGQGAMGSVWSAEHLSLRSQVAVKFIDPHIASEPDALARFLREARAAASLRSPHVVQILDHGVDNGAPYIVMELLEGETLGARLRRRGSLAPAEVADLLTQVARAVAKAHEVGIVHRDLKPDNIFIVQNDDADLAKVLDFGIAKVTGANVGASAPGTRSGALMGTPVYMSPEQAEGTKQVDFRSDLWSLGVIAYECLLGRRPFESEAIGSLVLDICSRPLPIPSDIGEVPAGFDAWFARACSRDPAGRFSGAKEQLQELRRILDPERIARSLESNASRLSAPVERSGVAAKPLLTATNDPTSSSYDRRASAPPRPRRTRAFVIAGIGAGVAAAALAYWGRSDDASKENKSVAGESEVAPHSSRATLDSNAESAPRAPLASASAPIAAPAPSANPAASSPALPELRKATVGQRAAEKAPEIARPAVKRETEGRATPSAPPAPPTAPTSTVNLGI